MEILIICLLFCCAFVAHFCKLMCKQTTFKYVQIASFINLYGFVKMQLLTYLRVVAFLCFF